MVYWGFRGGSADNESACNAGDLGSIPRLGRSLGEGNGYPLQFSGLENSMDCIVHGVAKSWIWLSDFHFHYGLSHDIELVFPLIYRRTLLFIHSMYKSLYLLIPTSPSVPACPSPLQSQICSLCPWFCFYFIHRWTWVSCIAGGFFTVWATREAHFKFHISVVSYDICLTYFT